MIVINGSLSIPDSELSFTFSRSSGPGGQNVNKVSTRVTLLFDVGKSPTLSPGQRDLLLERLRTRINREGILRVVSSRHRTQGANREAATEKFAALLREALKLKRPRKKPAIPRSLVERRLREKKRRSLLKINRSRNFDPEG